MNLRRTALAVTALATAVGLCACTSAAAGHGSTAPAVTASSSVPAPAPTTSTVPSVTPSTTPSDDPTTTAPDPSTTEPASSGSSRVSRAASLRCAGSPQDLVDCLGASLTAYWRGHLPDGAQTEQAVLLYLPSAAGDPCNQHAREAETPFTCTTDGRLFLPPAFQRRLAGSFSAGDLPYAYASILSHEYGHFLQLQLHDPTVGLTDPTQAQSRAVEQQADCLSGVWAHHAATDHGYDAGRFDATAMELIRQVSSNPEVYTHGTPDDRFAAIDRGLGTGKPSSCGLAGLD